MTNQNQTLAHVTTQLVRPGPDHRHVFAFDALMAEDAIRERCPDPRFVMTAHYTSKKFIINTDGVATLTPRRDFTVYGVVWEISNVAQIGLDVFMGMPGVFDRFGSFARGRAGEMISTEYYGARNFKPGKADPKYLAPIIAAARHWKFPDVYIDEIASWTRPEPRTAKPKRSPR